MANPLVKELLIEMRDYNIKKIENRSFPAFLASVNSLRDLYDKAKKFKKIYDKVSDRNNSGHTKSAVVLNLERSVTERSLRFSDEVMEIANAVAKEIEKINEHTDSVTKNRVKERLDADKKKSLNKSRDTINSVYESLVWTVEQHPEEELSILCISDVFSDGMNSIIRRIDDEVQLAIEDLSASAERIWERADQFYSDTVTAINKWFACWYFPDSADQSAG